MRESGGKLCLSEKEIGGIWNDNVKRIMNTENFFDHS